jgi:hypothetical protein
MSVGHTAMIPAMLAVMLLRFTRYAVTPHERHSTLPAVPAYACATPNWQTGILTV